MIHMALIIENHKIPIIEINSGSGNDRSSTASADVLSGDVRRTHVELGSDIISIRLIFVGSIFKPFKGISQFRGELI
nr:hypothetical protein [Hungatella effluvii]